MILNVPADGISRVGCFTYPARSPILHPLSFSLPQGPPTPCLLVSLVCGRSLAPIRVRRFEQGRHPL